VLEKISPIRDVIHDYIAPSIFESMIIDSPFFQRLHFVWQNSATYSVYPCNKNSRFVHSLGVSHICGRILVHSLRNSDEACLKTFLKNADTFIDKFVADLGLSNFDDNASEAYTTTWARDVGNLSRFRHNNLTTSQLNAFQAELGLKYSVEFIVNTLWISLRLVGLTHDIGHLPMSHEFEKVIGRLDLSALYFEEDPTNSLAEKLSKLKTKNPEDAFFRSSNNPNRPIESIGKLALLLGVPDSPLRALIISREIHELRSLRIVEELTWANHSADTDQVKYQKLLLRICFTVLLLCVEDKTLVAELPDNPVVNLFKTLKGVISGQLDADRLDYVLRDPAVSALETGKFDLNRIVRSFTLCKKANGELIIAPSTKALTAIEAFFHQRYLTYKTLIYHKSSLRTKAVLREALGLILAISVNDPSHEIGKICQRAGLILLVGQSVTLLPATPDYFAELDDARLRSVFFDVLRELKNPEKTLHPRLFIYDKIFPVLRTLLETFLFRKKNNVRTVEFDYLDFGGVAKESSSAKSELPPLQLEGITAFKDASSNFAKAMYHGDGVVGLFGERKPSVYNSRKDTLLISKNGDAIPAETLSPYLKMQVEMVASEPRFITFYCFDNIRSQSNPKAELIKSKAEKFWIEARSLVEAESKQIIATRAPSVSN
jgi:HD superfamily phosphohydrolase